VGAPDAEPLHRDELLDDLLVRQRRDPVQLERPVEHVLGQRPQEVRLRTRQPRGNAHLVRVRGEDLLRGRDLAPEEVEQPPVDRAGRERRQLLTDDRPQQRAVVVVLGWPVGRALARQRAVRFDDLAQDRVGLPEVPDRGGRVRAPWRAGPGGRPGGR
jgi:hypothetical protein